MNNSLAALIASAFVVVSINAIEDDVVPKSPFVEKEKQNGVKNSIVRIDAGKGKVMRNVNIQGGISPLPSQSPKKKLAPTRFKNGRSVSGGGGTGDGGG